MAQKLDADLNIIQRSNIEVQIDPITADLNIIQALDDEPNDVGGLSAAELKAKFDEAGNIIKTFINDSLIPQVTAETVSEEQRELNEQQRQDNEAQRQANEAVRQENEEEREAAEAARAVWEDYDPAKAYVPGNKVYWAGSSYVNKAPCTGVPPNVAANWQMVAKRGETVGDGMTEEDCDERYLQLSGGWMTGQMTVLEPELPNSPVPKSFISPESISVEQLPKKTMFYMGDTFDPSGMKVEAHYANGDTRRVTGYRCEPDVISIDTEEIDVQYMENHTLYTKTLPFSPELLGPESGRLIKSKMNGSFFEAVAFGGGVWILVSSQSPYTISRSDDDGRTWEQVSTNESTRLGVPVYGGGVWVVSGDSSTSSKFVLRSEDGGKTWERIELPVSGTWNTPVYGDNGEWVILNYHTNVSGNIIYSRDNGKTWSISKLPATPASAWDLAGYGGGVWVAIPYNVETNVIAYSENGGQTWLSATLPLTSQWNIPVYGGDVWIICPNAIITTIARSENGKAWTSVTVPRKKWRDPAYADGVWLMCAAETTNVIARSENGGKSWASVSLPDTQSFRWPTFGGGRWVLHGDSGSTLANVLHSEDGGKTWTISSLPISSIWNTPVFDGGVFIMTSKSDFTVALSSNDGGDTWWAVPLPENATWKTPVYGNGVWMLIGSKTNSNYNYAARMPMYKQLAPLPGQPAPAASIPPLSAQDQINALEAETAAITAAIERGLSL